MATIPVRTGVGGTGYRTSYTPVEAIVGGQVVEARALSTNKGSRACGVAGAASNLVAGVALHDVPATRGSIQGPQALDEHALTVVAYAEVPVTFAAAATRGQALIAAANGTVTPAGATPDGRQVIGYCRSDSVAQDAVGLAFIKPSGG